MNRRIVDALMRLYPAAWRKEYGPEFRPLLLALRLRLRTVADVVSNGLRQRLRATEPWLIMGVPLALIGAAGLAAIVLGPAPAYDPVLDRGAGRSPLVGLVALLVGVLPPLCCGLWTVARRGGTLPRAGLQTVKMGLLVLTPLLIVQALVLAGVLGVAVVGPGETPPEGLVVPLYRAGEGLPPDVATVGMIFGEIFSLLEYWILGALGGIGGRFVRPGLRPAH